ncbi:hypothetical protein L596_019710 [Steinernema carpocapsae]|uniref:Uncharacterized protein n=1 Tax=Steinernema carpocapsae TaxID=34508 RepID=A0A4U5MRC2_STECR|nr:hypothetical protein L596_019710 [Steinernema carpocapsae]
MCPENTVTFFQLPTRRTQRPSPSTASNGLLRTPLRHPSGHPDQRPEPLGQGVPPPQVVQFRRHVHEALADPRESFSHANASLLLHAPRSLSQLKETEGTVRGPVQLVRLARMHRRRPGQPPLRESVHSSALSRRIRLPRRIPSTLLHTGTYKESS